MRVVPVSVWRNPVHFLAFGFGAGASPLAPGTVGTLVAVPICVLMLDLPMPVYALIVLTMTAVGIWLCGKTSHDLGVHDHPGIVWDEIVGYLITMLPLSTHPDWVWLVVGFVLFRLFDIWKPFPIQWLDRHVAGGFGIMIDDVLAGVYAFLVLQVLIYFF